MRQDVHKGRLNQEGRDRGEGGWILQTHGSEPVLPGLSCPRQHQLQDKHHEHHAHGVAIEFECPRPDAVAANMVAVLHHLAGIDHAGQQTRQEDEALGVFDKGEISVVDLDEPEAAGEDHVIDQHEDEEVASHAIDDVQSFHVRLPR